MTIASELDPGGAEPRALFDAVDFSDARVLEVGCGNGRLSFRYAHASPFVVGIDPGAEEISAAVAARSADLEGRLRFLRAGALQLPFRDQSFDIVLLAWSL